MQFKEILVGKPEGFRFAQSPFHPFVGSLFSHFQSIVTLYQTIGLKSPLPSPSSSAAHPSWAGRKERSRVNVVKVRHKFLLSFRGWGCRWKQGSQSLCSSRHGGYIPWIELFGQEEKVRYSFQRVEKCIIFGKITICTNGPNQSTDVLLSETLGTFGRWKK